MKAIGKRRSLTEVYVVPTLLAATSAVGLFSALLGDGPWDALSWLTLALPLVPVAAVARRGPTSGPSRKSDRTAA